MPVGMFRKAQILPFALPLTRRRSSQVNRCEIENPLVAGEELQTMRAIVMYRAEALTPCGDRYASWSLARPISLRVFSGVIASIRLVIVFVPSFSVVVQRM
jgi:hypothetical protein